MFVSLLSNAECCVWVVGSKCRVTWSESTECWTVCSECRGWSSWSEHRLLLLLVERLDWRTMTEVTHWLSGQGEGVSWSQEWTGAGEWCGGDWAVLGGHAELALVLVDAGVNNLKQNMNLSAFQCSSNAPSNLVTHERTNRRTLCFIYNRDHWYLIFCC